MAQRLSSSFVNFYIYIKYFEERKAPPAMGYRGFEVQEFYSFAASELGIRAQNRSLLAKVGSNRCYKNTAKLQKRKQVL